MAAESSGMVACDLKMGASSETALSSGIVENLVMKGFCTIELGLDEDALDNVYREARAVEREGGFVDLPVEVADGLLGTSGSSRCVELPTDDVPEGMKQCDQALSSLAEMLAWHAPNLGFIARTRTHGVVVEAADTSKNKLGKEQAPKLSEEHITRWLATFESGRLLMLVFMGPGDGTLTLTPHDAETKPLEVDTRPGMAVVIRSDLLASKHVVVGRKGYVLCSFLVQDGRDPSGGNMPSAEKLVNWTQTRLQDLAKMGVDDMDKALAEFESPSWWRSVYDHTYHSVQQTAIRGIAMRYPSSWDIRTLASGGTAGTDLITAVPTLRWDQSQYYSPDPDGWKQFKINVNHMGYADGMELFDGKFFKIAPAESKSMDPMQRVILEAGYESLHMAGRTTKNLLNSLTGVFIATGVTEFPLIDAGPEESGGCEQRAAGTGIAAAIMSNRFSFAFGMQGPSVMVDTDASSSLTVLQLGVASIFQGKVNSTMACCGGMQVIQTPITWVGRIATGEMTSRGRCFAFNDGATGWIRSDGNGTVSVDNYLEEVNGQLVHDESREAVGIISSAVVRNVGRVASIATPSAAAMMNCLHETCRQAGVATTSIDAIECHGDAQMLQDAVEVHAIRKVMSQDGEVGSAEGRTPVMMNSVMTNVGNALQAANFAALIKMLYLQRIGSVAPTNHLNTLSPYIAFNDEMGDEEHPGQFLSECLSFPQRTSLAMVDACGFGGTIASCISTGYARTQGPATASKAAALNFWPAGGGKLSAIASPSAGYDIVGSWDGWAAPQRMEEEEKGVYGYTVTIGVNGSEEFRILLDGDESKILHPSIAYGSAGSSVEGPAESDEGKDDAQSFFWSIAGAPNSMLALGDGSTTAASPIGDKYRVRLHVAGKWR